MNEYYLCAMLLFVAGLGMCFVINTLGDWWGLFITFPLAWFIGKTSGQLASLGEKK